MHDTMANITENEDRKELYYLRFQLLLVKHGTGILRSKFDHLIPKNNLDIELKKQQGYISSPYIKKHLTKSEYGQLYPKGTSKAQPNSDNFDISLLVFLLRNITSLDKKSKWWNEKDNKNIDDSVTDIEADIVRLRNLRNELQHSTIASLEQSEFETKWDYTEKVIVRIAGNIGLADVKRQIEETKTKDLDLVPAGLKSLRASTCLFLEDYENEQLYAETKMFARAKAMLEKGLVIITGNPGEGKTTMAARLALSISKPRNCALLRNNGDWRYIDTSLKLIETVIIDDIYGTGSMNQRLVDEWGPFLLDILKAAEKSLIRVIITSRDYILTDAQETFRYNKIFDDDKTKQSAHIHLSSVDLDREEKIEILNRLHKKHHKSVDDAIIKECVDNSGTSRESLFGFPECASMFLRSEDIFAKGTSFFKEPVMFLKTYLCQLYTVKDKIPFFTFVLLWSNESKTLRKDEVDRLKNVSPHVENVAKIYDLALDRNFLTSVKNTLDSHAKGLLSIQDEEKYSFSHEIIGDIVGLVIGEKETEQTLEVCPRDFLMERITIDVDYSKSKKLSVQAKLYPALIRRCVDLILRENCNSILEQQQSDFVSLKREKTRTNKVEVHHQIDFGIIKHEAFGSESFVKQFVDYVFEEKRCKRLLDTSVITMNGYFFHYGIRVSELKMELVDYAWHIGVTVFAKHIVSKRTIQEDCGLNLTMSLLLAVHSKDIERVTFLLQHGAKVTGNAIYIAIHIRRLDILRALLEQPGADANDRGDLLNGNYPVIIAARKGYKEELNCLLQHGVKTDVATNDNMTALHRAVQNKHNDIVDLVVDAGAALDIRGGKFRRTPLHIAVERGDEEMVDKLIQKGASLFVRDHRNQYPIHTAAIRGHVNVVRKLIMTDRNQEKLRITSYGKKSQIKGMTIFHIAVWKKNAELLNILITSNVTPNYPDCHGRTPLLYSITQKEEDFALKLLDYARVDKKKAQKQGYSPLHSAIHFRLTKTALLLIPHSDVNARDKFGKTPLHVACKSFDASIIDGLLQKGADWHMLTYRGDSIFHILERNMHKLSGRDAVNVRCAGLFFAQFDPNFAAMQPNLKNKRGCIAHFNTEGNSTRCTSLVDYLKISSSTINEPKESSSDNDNSNSDENVSEGDNGTVDCENEDDSSDERDSDDSDNDFDNDSYNHFYNDSDNDFDSDSDNDTDEW